MKTKIYIHYPQIDKGRMDDYPTGFGVENSFVSNNGGISFFKKLSGRNIAIASFFKKSPDRNITIAPFFKKSPDRKRGAD